MGLTGEERNELDQRLAALNQRLDEAESLLLAVRTNLHLIRTDVARLQRESDMKTQKGDDN